MAKYLDLAGLTAYDAKIKEWIKSGVVDIAEDAIRELFVTSAYRMVDLGLPSGIKWADRNVGAETPHDNGLYFSWGNIDGHAVDENGNVTDGYSFDENTYPTTLGGKYTGSTLDAEHDAATVNMGSDWRMPTMSETSELVMWADHYYISEDGSIVTESELDDSIKLRSICFVKSGEEFNYNDRSNFIEFPFAGKCYNSSLEYKGVYGNIWSSSATEINTMNIHKLGFGRNGSLSGYNPAVRYYGFSVRGVHA